MLKNKKWIKAKTNSKSPEKKQKLSKTGFHVASTSREWIVTDGKQYIRHVRTKYEIELRYIDISSVKSWVKHLKKKSWVSKKTIEDFITTLKIQELIQM